MSEEITPEIIEQKKAELGESDARIQFEKFYASGGIPISWEISPSLGMTVVAEMPNGRKKRRLRVDAQLAQEFWSLEYPTFTYLGDFDAALFLDRGVIEATLLPLPPNGPGLQDLAGVEKIGPQQMTLLDEDEEREIGPRIGRSRDDEAWVLKLTPAPSNPDMRLELGSASRVFNAVSDRYRRRTVGREPLPLGLGRFPTLRISGVTVTRHDEALDILTRVSGALFFELDLQHGISPELALSMTATRERLRGRFRQRREVSQETPRNPQNQYPEKPLNLYWYGRSSSRLPLLEYLAYYQVLEYFFPSFSRRETLERLRNELLDPRFRPDDDNNLVRIINLASGTGRGFISEREQLRSTIGGCVTEDHIRDFITGDDILSDHFSGKQKIKDVAHLNLADAKSDLLTAVANRVYDIRCRIVHAKEDGGSSAVDLLLPFSTEADSLGPDIALARFLAQKVLIAGASRLSF
ncbi:hypothetical protein ACIQJT_15060 [Streptomyces sp. NPDC091972]|uniref:hypothetical protein n=1 Tax=Streptomyces sp. NPDC091972 TaxID=3366007 RepID=UPI00380440AA